MAQDTNIVILAIVLGIFSGLLGVIFRYALDFITELTFGGNSLNFVGGISEYSWWYIVCIPVIGGCVVGLIKYIFYTNSLNGMHEIIVFSVRKNYKMSFKETFITFIVNIVTLGTGGSSGSLGPTVHWVGGVCASILQKMKIPHHHRRTILGCVVAGAVGSSLNAPMAGMFFAIELIVGSYAVSFVLPIVIASVSGTLITNMIYGEYSGFSLSGLSGVSPVELPLFIILGLVTAFVARAFIQGLDFMERMRKVFGISVCISPAVGGLGVGLIALVFPQVLGTGYFATDATLTGSLSLLVLGMLVIAKFCATMCTLGLGGGGGMFFPSMFIGALFGGFFGSLCMTVASMFGVDMGNAYVAYAMGGMGAMSASILGAPVSAIFLIFELSHNYSLSLSVMVSTLIAARCMQVMKIKSVFVHQLGKRGFDLSGSADMVYSRDITAQELLSKDYCHVHIDTNIKTVRDTLITSPLGRVYVLDKTGKLQGDISLYSMGEYAFEKQNDETICVQDIMHTDTQYVSANTNLDMILPKYQLHKDTVFVVVDDDHKMLGILHENDVLIAYKDVVKNSREQERI